MTETYTSGSWTVREGAEDEFVAAWRDFAGWARTMPGCGTLNLVRDTEDASSFRSFGSWESFEAQRAWKSEPEFKERIGRVIRHTTSFTPSTHALVARVE